jgi:hypothetical protein
MEGGGEGSREIREGSSYGGIEESRARTSKVGCKGMMERAPMITIFPVRTGRMWLGWTKPGLPGQGEKGSGTTGTKACPPRRPIGFSPVIRVGQEKR